jgi:hypothetical protein
MTYKQLKEKLEQLGVEDDTELNTSTIKESEYMQYTVEGAKKSKCIEVSMFIKGEIL